MDQALLRTLSVPASMRKHTVCRPGNVVIGILDLELLDISNAELGDRGHAGAQVRRVSLAIRHHAGRTITVLTGQDWDSQSQGLQH